MIRHKWLAGMMTATLACFITMAEPLQSLAATTTPVALPSVAPSNALQRLSGQDRYETAAKIAEQGWLTNSDNAILAAGMDNNLVDALTAAPLAKALHAPILLTQGDSLNPYAQAELKRLGVKTVYVTSGAGVIQAAVTDQLSALGITVKPLGGSDRFATALNIAQALGTLAPFSQLVVASANSNADALSVAGIAAAQGMPILLTDVDTLPPATAAYINSLSGITHTYIVGGTGVVSEAVKNALPNAQRAGGADRFETNCLILQLFTPELKYGQIYVANGEDAHLVDALAVAPLAAQTNSPVVMSDQQVPANTLTYVKTNLLPKTITVLGGESVLPTASLSGLNSSLIYAQAGDTEGSTDPNNKALLTDSLNITGDNVTVQNALIPFSLYVTGQNATLTNLQVTGTIFLDPGASGVATLNNVSAANLVVLSGTVKGQLTSTATTPATPSPASVSTVPVTPPATDGTTPPATDGTTPPATGGTTPPATDGTTPPDATTTLAASSVMAQINIATYNRSSAGATSFNLDLSGVPDSARLMGIQISSNGTSPSLTINSILTAGAGNLLSTPEMAPLTNGVVSVSTLLGSLDQKQNGVSLKTLRTVLGSGAITLTGFLSESGYNDSPAVTVAINLGALTTIPPTSTAVQN